MNAPISFPRLSEAEVLRLISSPEVSSRLANPLGEGIQVTTLSDRKGTYTVTGSQGDFIVRLACDEAHLATLRREANIQKGLRRWVAVRIPDTQVIDGLERAPAFAIHRLIPGEPLTSSYLLNLSPEAHQRLLQDLVQFFHATHRIPLKLACEWLDIPFNREKTTAELALAYGKPTWFSTQAVAEMRPILKPRLDDTLLGLFKETAYLFEALKINPDFMVFGHGDMHGFNMAMGADPSGASLIGVFDLECAGILDIHEDFFRLSLVSEDLLEHVLAAYQNLPGRTCPINRDRIAIYYRAFLFYLMAEAPEENLAHLKAMLHKHMEYYGPISTAP
jgi:aminoglycoside phosphotransferase (APT) family kinase protein